MRQRVSAIVIENKKILLTKDFDVNHFDTPGGAIDENETKEVALARELREELNVNLISLKFLFYHDSFHTKVKVMQRDFNFQVEIAGNPKPNNEIETYNWFSKDDILKKKVQVLPQFYDVVLPRLIEIGLI